MEKQQSNVVKTGKGWPISEMTVGVTTVGLEHFTNMKSSRVSEFAKIILVNFSIYRIDCNMTSFLLDLDRYRRGLN